MKLDQLLEKNDGLLRREDALDTGVSNGTFYNFVRKNNLQKVTKGIYIAPDAYPDEMYLLQLRYPKAVFSHETALYLHDLSEREPVPLSVTVPSSYNVASLLDSGARIYYTKQGWHDLGVDVMESPEGNPIYVYDIDRTICDTIRRRSAMDTSSFNYAMRGYIGSKKKDLNRLGRYAAVMNMDGRVRKALGVLL